MKWCKNRLANLAAHGDSNNNNAAVGQGEGALEAPDEDVRQAPYGIFHLMTKIENPLLQLVVLKLWWHSHSPVQMHPQVFKRGRPVLSGDCLCQKQTALQLDVKAVFHL